MKFLSFMQRVSTGKVVLALIIPAIMVYFIMLLYTIPQVSAYAPGINLLSTKEIALCEKICLLPQFYLEVKRELIQESLSQGFIEDGNSSSLVKIDIEKKGEVIQFMLSSGWIKVKN